MLQGGHGIFGAYHQSEGRNRISCLGTHYNDQFGMRHTSAWSMVYRTLKPLGHLLTVSKGLKGRPFGDKEAKLSVGN